MKGFKQCDQGHFYSDKLSECNYCPKNKSSNSKEKTEVLGSDNDQTIDIATDKTQVFGGGSSSSSNKSSEESFDPNKTTISRLITNNEGKVNKVTNDPNQQPIKGLYMYKDLS